ncbi:MAG: PocR ligand-binding domain-containing protein [Armatimonadota bacterium]
MKRPLETILKQDVQGILDHFCACFDIRTLFYSPSGEMLKVGLNHSDSDYCTLIRSCLYGPQVCLELDARKRNTSATQRELICYECHAGLMEAVKPIYFEKHLLGFVMIGQFRSDESLPERIAADGRKSGNFEELEVAYLRLPYVPKERIDDILALFSALVDYMVLQRMVLLKGDAALDEIISYLESHPQENLTLSDAAKMVCKSPSTVSHLFTQKLGRSFKQIAIEIKLRVAEEYMDHEPGVTVAEVARKVGYDDPLYFSRIYKRHRGVPPVRFLRQRPGE